MRALRQMGSQDAGESGSGAQGELGQLHPEGHPELTATLDELVRTRGETADRD